MRRIALAMAPVFALLAATLPALPAQSAVGLDSAASALGAKFVSVSWNWNHNDSGYRVQVSKTKSFSSILTTRKARRDSSRPPSGRQATVIGHLHDASYYWVRVRKVQGTHKSSWSRPVRVATKAHWPDAITSVSDDFGSQPGETTITWQAGGGYTDFYKIETALTPFAPNKPGVPDHGRHSRVFTVPGDARSLTLTPAQTRDAGAGVGSGQHLFFRIKAVRKGEADSQSRAYGPLQFASIAGQDPVPNAAPIRVASYNVHVASADVQGHSWATRAPLVAANIALQHPAIVAMQELVPGMWTNKDGGPGLDAALGSVGLGAYTLTRDTPWDSNNPEDARILYDPNQVQMLSRCDSTKPSCGITVPDGGDVLVAPYALFQDRSSGQQFWFVSAHLTHGNTATLDTLRGKQAQAIVNGMANLNTQHLPVILGGDLNSSQTSVGHDAPHQAFTGAGFYDSASATRQVHMQYNTMNGYESPEQPSNYGFGARLDAIMTLGMPGATRFEQVITGGPYPSDHNLVVADLGLPTS
jgi:endonuclease/exonuclease/phosphatase family metal-dependent hydrolase